MRKRLEESLNTSADYLTKIGNIVKTNFKGAKWCTSFLWALEQYPDLKAYYCQKLYKDTAEEMGLECWIGADIIPTEEVKLNRRLVELQIAPSQKAIKEYKITPEIKAYLCTGAIYIDKGGAVKIATNATDLIADYCSVFVENTKEMAFIKNLAALQDAANKLEKCYQDFKDQVRDKGAINSVNWRKGDFNIAKNHICDSLPLMSDSTIWRAFVSLCLLDNPKKTPHFYNRVGKPKVSIEELHALSGYLPTATPELCVKFPQLYPVSSLKKTSKETEDAIRNVKERIKEDKYLIDERGLIEMNPAKCITPKYAVIYPEIN